MTVSLAAFFQESQACQSFEKGPTLSLLSLAASLLPCPPLPHFFLRYYLWSNTSLVTLWARHGPLSLGICQKLPSLLWILRAFSAVTVPCNDNLLNLLSAVFQFRSSKLWKRSSLLSYWTSKVFSYLSKAVEAKHRQVSLGYPYTLALSYVRRPAAFSLTTFSPANVDNGREGGGRE